MTLVTGEECLRTDHYADVEFISSVPGVNAELQFADGGYFVATDDTFRWPSRGRKGQRLSKLESNRGVIGFALLLTPIALWAIYRFLIPVMATQVATSVPTEVVEQVDRQALSLLRNKWLADSQILQVQQTALRQRFRQLVKQVATNPERYRLYLADSPSLGANALALPAGSVVATDQLVQQLGANSDELMAVLLHEIGHVEQQHGIKMMAQSTSIAIVVAAIMGDVQIVGDLLLGAGTIMLDQAFSRDMERQADAFARQHLAALPLANDALSKALGTMMAERGESSAWTQYLSSHPPTEERINDANEH